MTGIGAYERFNAYPTNPYLGRTAIYSSIGLFNTNAETERQKELEFGTDLGFFSNRLSLQFNYYIKKVSNLLLRRDIAPTNGYSNLLDNVGSLENKGLEVVLSGTPFRDKDWSWDVTAIFNRNRNKALKVGQAISLVGVSGLAYLGGGRLSYRCILWNFLCQRQ